MHGGNVGWLPLARLASAGEAVNVPAVLTVKRKCQFGMIVDVVQIVHVSKIDER